LACPTVLGDVSVMMILIPVWNMLSGMLEYIGETDDYVYGIKEIIII
jgi:hypothetical protein